MAGRQLFFSFHYKVDNWRASQIRNMGIVDGNKPVSDNDWEQVKKGGDSAIEKWIVEQMKYRSCTAVLVGTGTAGRRWIDYEIEKSWTQKMGIFGIYIHNLKNSTGGQSLHGQNPFYNHRIGNLSMSSIVKCYDPPSSVSTDVYGYIKSNNATWADEAVNIRNKY
jgi:hypothetical protein